MDNPRPDLFDYFDRVFVINCEHREDRLRRFISDLRLSQVTDTPQRVEQFSAVRGVKLAPPDSWDSTKGAWGCMRSHQRLLEDLCSSSGWRRALILEDDAVFLPGMNAELFEFLDQVPENWDQVYLGGQVRGVEHRKLSDLVMRPERVNRTHAYVVNSRSAHALYKHISELAAYTRGHVDHRMEDLHREPTWRVYVPKNWFVGQAAGESDVTQQTTPQLTWQKPW